MNPDHLRVAMGGSGDAAEDGMIPQAKKWNPGKELWPQREENLCASN